MVLAHLQVQRIQPHVGIAAFKATIAESLCQLIQLLADAGHLALVNPSQTHGPQEIIYLPCAHSLHICGLHHTQQGLLRSAPRLQQAREGGAFPELWNTQWNLADSRLPDSISMPI